jgi:hypothetical protein
MKRKQENVTESANEPKTKIETKVELNLFADPLKQDSIEESYRMEYGPQGTITDSGPISFEIPKSDKLFTDLGSIFVEVTLNVSKANGDDLDTNDEKRIQPCNNFLDSLFSRVNVSINDTPVGSDGNFHPQISLVKNLLTYNYETLDSTLNKSIGWHNDGIYPVDLPKNRHAWIAKSKYLTLLGRLTDNFLTTKNLMIPNVPISIVLHRTPSHFSLIRTTVPTTEPPTPPYTNTYKINIKNCTLIARRVKLNEPTFNHLESQLARGAAAKYSYFDTVARTTQISIGSDHWRGRNMFNGRLPSRVLLGVCDHLGTIGSDWENNPMIFPSAHYGVNYIQFYADERPLLKRPYRPDFKNEDTSRSYIGLLEAARVLQTGSAIAINTKLFNGNYGLFGLDLAADGTNLTHTEKKGNFDIEIGFASNIKTRKDKTLCGFLIGEFPSICTIDKNCQVFNHNL